MKYFEKVKIGFAKNKNPFSPTLKALEHLATALIAAMWSILLFVWSIFMLISSPFRYFLSPFWYAFKLRKNDEFWENMKNTIDANKKNKKKISS